MAFYAIWTLIQTIVINWSLLLLTDINPNFLGLLLLVIFFQLAVTFPVLAMVSNSKNENR